MGCLGEEKGGQIDGGADSRPAGRSWGGVGGQIERAVLFEEAKEHGSWSNLVRGRLTLRRKEERRRHMERSSTRHPRRHHRKRPTLDPGHADSDSSCDRRRREDREFQNKSKLENKSPSISSARTDHKGERGGRGRRTGWKMRSGEGWRMTEGSLGDPSGYF